MVPSLVMTIEFDSSRCLATMLRSLDIFLKSRFTLACSALSTFIFGFAFRSKSILLARASRQTTFADFFQKILEIADLAVELELVLESSALDLRLLFLEDFEIFGHFEEQIAQVASAQRVEVRFVLGAQQDLFFVLTTGLVENQRDLVKSTEREPG